MWARPLFVSKENDTRRHDWGPKPLFSNPGIGPGGWRKEACCSEGGPRRPVSQSFMQLPHHAGHSSGVLLSFNKIAAMGTSSVPRLVTGHPLLSCLLAPRLGQGSLHIPFQKLGWLSSLSWSSFSWRASQRTEPCSLAGRSGRGQGRLGRFLFPEGPRTSSPQLGGEHRTLHGCTRTGIQPLRQSGIHRDQVFPLHGLKWLFYARLAEIRSISVDSGFT